MNSTLYCGEAIRRLNALAIGTTDETSRPLEPPEFNPKDESVLGAVEAMENLCPSLLNFTPTPLSAERDTATISTSTCTASCEATSDKSSTSLPVTNFASER